MGKITFVYLKKFTKHYQKRIRPSFKLDQQFQKRLELLLNDPDSSLLKIHKLTGSLGEYCALSISGDIRLVFKKDDNIIYLYDIGSHNQVY